MTVAIEAFLDLEHSLTARLNSSFRAENAGVIGDALRAVKRDEFDEAAEIIEGISFSQTVAKNLGYIQLVGLQSVLYGASQIGDLSDSVFLDGGIPDEVLRAANVLILGLVELSRTNVIRTVQKELAKQDKAAKENQTVTKADDTFVRGFVSFVGATGQAEIMVGSSLHNSRMSQFGFITEAQLNDITTYRVNEQLDGRTCPVCELMHNTVFQVSTASTKLDQWLAIEDPEDFKSIAPWPSQTKQGIAELSSMTIEEAAERGYDTPPYHPLCRGQLATTVSEFRATATIGGGPAIGDSLKLPPALQVLRPVDAIFTPEPAPAAVASNTLPTLTEILVSEGLSEAAEELDLIETESTPGPLGNLLNFFR